jgi:Family of unknown function (DUF5681)
VATVTKPPDDAPAPPDPNRKKQGDGKFQKGVSGNRAGRPRGRRSITTQWTENMTQEEREAANAKLTRLLLKGDRAVLKMYADRTDPIRKAAGKFKLPDTIATLEDVDAALSSVVSAQSAGKLLPDEVAAALSTIEAKRVLIMSRNLEPQLGEIEKMISDMKGRP